MEITLILHKQYKISTETVEFNLLLHLDYNNTTETMEFNFLLTFRLQQNHGDDGNHINFT